MCGSSTTPPKPKIRSRLEGSFRYSKLEFGFKVEQIIFGIVTCLRLKGCLKPAVNIRFFIVSL